VLLAGSRMVNRLRRYRILDGLRNGGIGRSFSDLAAHRGHRNSDRRTDLPSLTARSTPSPGRRPSTAVACAAGCVDRDNPAVRADQPTASVKVAVVL